MTVLVIGAGAAGTSAALAAAELGADVLVVTAGAADDSATAWAQGGIAAAIGAEDSIESHVRDTLAAGAGLCDADAVRVLAREGAEHVRELLAAGFPADRDASGAIALGLEAAHARPRIVHAGGDRTGAALAAWLLDRVAAAGIVLRERTRLVELVVRDGVVRGAIVEEAGRLSVIDADAVVLATGGLGRLYPTTSNPAGARGDGLLAAWDAGAHLADLEFVQFHPTTLPFAGDFLVSEAVRGAGAVILDETGRRFLLDADPRGELAPRDVVAAAVWRRVREQDGRPVMLDATGIERRDGAGTLTRRFPTIDGVIRGHGHDWSTSPVPIMPAAHFAMGGVRTDLDGRSSVPGLLAAGECARTGVHGANRLASNSLLEGLVFGARAGRAAARGDGDAPTWPCDSVEEPAPHLPTATTSDLRSGPERGGPAGRAGVPTLERVRAAMADGVGIERDAAGLEATLGVLEAARSHPGASDAVHAAARLGALVASAALRREESRGAHRRTDFPEPDPRLAAPLALARGRRISPVAAGRSEDSCSPLP